MKWFWITRYFFLFLYSLSLSRLLQNRIHWLLERKSFNQRMDFVSGLYGWLSLEVIFVPQPTASKHSSSTLDHFDVGMSDPRDEKRVQDKAVDGK